MSAYLMVGIEGAAPRLVERSVATISAQDRGFLYGDGLFETIRVVQGRTPYLASHLERLGAGAATLLFPRLPWRLDELAAACHDLIRANHVTDGYVRLTVSRGPAARGYEAPPDPTPTLVMQASEWRPAPDLYTAGYRAVLSSVRVSAHSPLCRVKSLSALEKVIARTQAAQQGCNEALLLNTDGYLTEGAATNLFVVREQRLLTPALACGLLPGIGRRQALQLARALGYPCEEGFLTVEDLWRADEAFVTNALVLAVPLTAVDGRPIGHGGRPGPVTAAILAGLRRAMGIE
jgi:branched-chain amino acid aminotransferase